VRTLCLAAALLASVTVVQAKPVFVGDGVHDDTEALEAIALGCPVDASQSAGRLTIISELDAYHNKLAVSAIEGAKIKISRPIAFQARRYVVWLISRSEVITSTSRTEVRFIHSANLADRPTVSPCDGPEV